MSEIHANGLSIGFGNYPPATSNLTLTYVGQATRSFALLDVPSDPETGLSSAQIVDLIGRLVARLEAIPDAARRD